MVEQETSLQEGKMKQSTQTKTQPLIPKLRFKEFDGDIKETFFGKLYSFHTTNSLSRDKLNYENGEIRNIHYGDIHTKFQSHFHLEKEYVPFINSNVDISKIKNDSYSKLGDLIIADASEDYADIGKSIELINLNNEKLVAGLHTFLARPVTDKTAIGYISYVLKSWKLRKQIMTIAQGTKVLSLSTNRFSLLKLVLPSLPEQHKIASFLSAVDEKIQQLTQKKSLLEQYKKGVMQQLFSGKLRFKDENGENFPDWEEKRFFDLFDDVLDFRGRTPLKMGMEWGGDILSLSANNVKNGFIDLTAEGNLGSEDLYEKWMGKVNLEKGDIVFTMEAPLGKALLVPDNKKYILSQRVVAFKSIKNISNAFLIQLIWSSKFQNTITRLSTGSTAKGINQKSLKKVKVDIPCIKEQQKIANYLSVIDTKIETVNQQIEKTQEFKRGLLQQMFV
ncbi:restriction endonuclease subunit S [Maribacter confluentis]|uniref:Restriction endonuclease subunit S n=1 Tax=Maribacter confluentis TaxID=1656093 RepID=A0ABT8RPL5_9FLAO|nr:restriction endonuclease subunit S [Maribacter confluentis]MDO1512854.1 restriction endonuclease subunit S [Maribacter confluentis]